LTRHALRSGRFLQATSAQSCPGARLHSCASAPLRAGFAAATPILRATIGVKALTRMRFRLGSAVRCFARQLAIPQFGFRTPRVRPLGLCRPRRPISLFCRGVHERRRHNPQVLMPMWHPIPRTVGLRSRSLAQATRAAGTSKELRRTPCRRGHRCHQGLDCPSHPCRRSRRKKSCSATSRVAGEVPTMPTFSRGSPLPRRRFNARSAYARGRIRTRVGCASGRLALSLCAAEHAAPDVG
jgi:hypothetical protein